MCLAQDYLRRTVWKGGFRMCLETDRFALWIYEEIANRPDILPEERWPSPVDGLYAADGVTCKNTFNMD